MYEQYAVGTLLPSRPNNIMMGTLQGNLRVFLYFFKNEDSSAKIGVILKKLNYLKI